jgi:hypothetical protein
MRQSNKPIRTRAPDGVVVGKPVGLRLLQEERDELINIATIENRSIAAQARVFFLAGLELYKHQKSA